MSEIVTWESPQARAYGLTNEWTLDRAPATQWHPDRAGGGANPAAYRAKLSNSK